ncbi:hypothetical protein OAE37_00355 [Pirellulaceae bacterium]|nr:hypothetical protein [Pirellulaceae bacterium]
MNRKLSAYVLLLFLCCRALPADDRSFAEFYAAMTLIRDPRVRKELDISESQHKDLQELIRAMQTNMVRLRFALGRRGVPAFEENLKKADAFVAANEKKIKEVLIKFQYDRLLQIARQNEASMLVPTSGLTKPQYADAIGLTGGDKAKIKVLEKEIELEIVKLHEKFNNDMKKLLASRNRRIRESLSEEQAAKFEELFGVPFVPILEMYMFSRYWENRAYSERLTEKVEGTGEKPPIFDK